MKYNRKNLPNSRAKLDEFVRENGLHPYGVVSYQGRDIFLAETDLEMDDPITHPLGYWQAAWFVTAPDSMEKIDGGSWGIYDAFHDMDKGWTAEAKREARIQDMMQKAKEWIDKSKEVGRYDA